MPRPIPTRNRVAVLPGAGLGTFVLGAVLAAAGGYMLATRAVVTTGYWELWGHSSFGMSLVPFALGLALVFFGRPLVGWTMALCGLAIIGAGLVMNLHLLFRPTTLYEMLLMVAMLMAGVGLLARCFVSFARNGV